MSQNTHPKNPKVQSQPIENGINPQQINKERLHTNEHEEKQSTHEHEHNRPKMTNFESMQSNFVYPPPSSQLGKELEAKKQHNETNIHHQQPHHQLGQQQQQHHQLGQQQQQHHQQHEHDQKFDAATPFLDNKGHAKIDMDKPIDHTAEAHKDEGVWGDVKHAGEEVKEFGGRLVEGGGKVAHNIADATAPARETIVDTAKKVGSAIAGFSHQVGESLGIVEDTHKKEVHDAPVSTTTTTTTTAVDHPPAKVVDRNIIDHNVANQHIAHNNDAVDRRDNKKDNIRPERDSYL